MVGTNRRARGPTLSGIFGVGGVGSLEFACSSRSDEEAASLGRGTVVAIGDAGVDGFQDSSSDDDVTLLRICMGSGLLLLNG